MEAQNRFLALFNNISIFINQPSGIGFSDIVSSVSRLFQKRLYTRLIIILTFFSFFTSSFSQTTYHWRAAAGTGNWTNPANWSTAGRLGAPAANAPGNLNTDIAIFDGISGIIVSIDQDLNIGKLNITNSSNITLQPSGANRIITIRTNATDAFTIDATSVMDLTGNPGGNLDLDLTFAGPVALNQNIAGYFKVSDNGGTASFSRNNAPITFGAAATFEHARDGGAIPDATWHESSLLYVTGIETSAFIPFTTNQSFGNFTWDCPLQDDLQVLIGSVAGVTLTVKGNMNIINSGYEFLMLIDANRTATLQVHGNITIGDGVNDGRFYLNGGTQNTVLNIGGDLLVNLNGRFELQNGTSIVNFGIAGEAMNTTWGGTGTFANDDISYVIRNLPAGKTVTLNGFASNILLLAYGSSVTVSSGTTLHCQTQVIGGTGNFTLEAGGTLGLGHLNGLDGNITTNGTVNFNASGAGTTFIYNGSTSHQITGTSLPAAITNLRIENTFPNGIVTLSNTTAISGTLTLNSSVLSIGANDITLENGASLAGNPFGTTNMVATGTGKFFKYFLAGNTPAFTYPLGEMGGPEYTPVTLDFSSNTTSGPVGLGLTDAVHPSITSGGTPTGYLSRYWTWSAPGLTDYTYNVSTYTYSGADVTGTENEIKLSFWNGSVWTPADNSAASANSLSISSPLTNITGSLNGTASTGRSRICIGDTEIPVIACPPDIMQTVDAGSCSAMVSVPAPVMTDNCAVPMLSWEITGATAATGSGPIGIRSFNSGLNTVTFTATDGSGNSASCNFTVTVTDNVPPSIVCPGNISVFSNPGSCGAIVTYVSPVGTDNCPGQVTVRTAGLASGSMFPAGTTTNTFTVTDAAGNSTFCSFNITVTDNEVPVAICRNFSLYLDAAGNAILSPADINNGSADNCSVLSFALSRTNFFCADIGAPVAVTLTVTDTTGNSTSCNSMITVLDTVKPIVNVKTFNLVLGPSGTGTLLPSDVDNGSFDNCGPVTLAVFPNTFSCSSQGAQMVTLTATDSHGSSRSKQVQITVSSSLNIDALSLSTCDLAEPYALYSSTVTGGDGNYTYLWDGLEDNVDPFVYFDLLPPFLHFTNTSTTPTPFFNNLMPDGTYNIRLVVTDGNGCTDTSQFVLNKGGVVYNNINVRYSDACEGSVETYSVKSDPTATYSWSVVNGAIQGSSTNSSVQVLWDLGVTGGVIIGSTTKPDLLGNPCGSSVVDSVSIHTAPVPAFNNPVMSVCANRVITYTLTGTYATYSWSVTGGLITNGGTISDNYVTVLWGSGPTGRVTASAGESVTCTGTVFVDVNIFNMTGSITSQTNITCNGAANGSVTVTAASGQPFYMYSLDGGPYQAGSTFNNIGPGNHFVRIRDMLLCSIDLPFTITEPSVLLGSVLSQTNVTCNGGSDGSATILASGGGLPYQYSIDGGAYQLSNIFTGLTAGSHTVVIRDVNLCTRNVLLAITQPVSLTGTISLLNDVDCFGNSTGSFTVTGSGGVAPYTYRLGSGAFQASGAFSGLAAANYTVTVRDASLCTVDIPVTIDQPAILNGVVASQVNAVCFSTATGQVTISAGGGTSPYQYSINAGPFQLSPTFIGLAAGSYSVTVRDANLCTDDVPVTITEPPLLTATASANTPVCQGTALNLSGGPAGMASYSWTGPNGFTSSARNPNVSMSATPVMSGVYNLTITSPAGCISTANVNVIVNPLNTIILTSAAATENQSLCLSAPIINITYSTTGATGANVTGLPAGVLGTFAGNVVTISGVPGSAGTFNYSVILTGGCGVVTESGRITVNPDNTITLTSPPGTANQMVCLNSPVINIVYSATVATGAVFAGLPAGVTGTWNSNVVTISGVPLSAGSFGYTVTLTGGCGLATAAGNIQVNAGPTVTTHNPAPSCSPVDLTLPAVTSGSTAGLNFTYWTDAAGTIACATPSAVAGGTYYIKGTDPVTGCYDIKPVTVTINAMPSVVIINPAPVCSPATVDITAAAITQGSTAGLTFTWWTDAAGTVAYASPSTAAAGTYYIKGTDPVTGCYDIKPVIVVVNELPSVSSVQTNVLCFGGTTGAIDISVTGSAPYTFAWTGTGVIAASEDQTGLLAGIYEVIVTDANNCQSVNHQVTISQVASAVSGSIISQTDVTVYGGNDGSVEVAGSGGVGPYMYSLNAGPYQVSGTFISLIAGTHTFTVQDANLCTFDIQVIINQPLYGSVTGQTNVSCFGGSDGSVTVTAAGGITPYEYQLNGGAWQASGTFGSLQATSYTVTIRDADLVTFDVPITLSSPSEAVGGTIISQTDVLCFGGNTGTVTIAGTGGVAPYQYRADGGTLQGSGIFNLQAGTHTITVVDSKLCSFSTDIVVGEPVAALTATISLQVNATCNGQANGTATAAASGGTAPYMYSLDGGPFQVSGSFTALSGGSHSIMARDVNLCTFNLPVSILEPAALAITADVTDEDCPGTNMGMIVLNIAGGTQPYTLLWSDGDTRVSRPGLSGGDYAVVVTDANGCAGALNVTVGVTGSESCIEIPVIITPNGDGYNDTWRIKNIDLFPDAEVVIFNRWGKRVFSSTNILANPWDGTLQGKLLPVDSYHFILDLHNGSKPKSGVISIIK